MKTRQGNGSLFLFTLIDDLFPGKGKQGDEKDSVSDWLFYGLLIASTLGALLLGMIRQGWMRN